MRQITKRSMAVLLIIMTVISVFSIVPITANAAAGDQFTAYVNSPGSAPLDSTSTTRHYTVTTPGAGKWDAICIDPCKGIPTGERTWKCTYSASDKAESLNRQMLRKILYYGYLGPGAQLKIKSTDGKTEKTANQWIEEAISSNDSVQNAQHEALAWWYKAEYDWMNNWNNGNWHNGYGPIYTQSTYHGDATMWKWHADIYNYIKTINWFPPAPPVEIFRSTGGSGQDLIAWKFYVHYLVEKDSTNSTVKPSMNGIKYKITDSGDTSWSTNIHLNYDHRSNANQANDGRYNFENTNAGVYVNSTGSYEGFLANSNDSFANKTAGSKRIQKGVARAVEYETNNAYVKSGTQYQMIYTGRKTTNGYGVLVPWNNTAQKQWPKDTPNAVYQIKKTSSATNQGVQITGAIYAIFTDKNAADKANNKTYASAQAAIDAAPNSWIKIDKDGYGKWGDGDGKNPSNDEAVYRNKNSGKPTAADRTYYAREIWAPSGYTIDKTTYEFKYSGKVDTNGVPIFRPTAASTDVLNIKLQAAKVSSKPNITDENAAYSYAGAEFTVYYKDGNEYKEFKPEGSVIKLTTDEDSYAKYGTDPQGATNNKASDYAPFKNKNSGKPIPMKTDVELYIKETKAPKGYVATDTYYKLVRQNLTDSKEYYIYRASDKTAVNPTAAAGEDSQKISNMPEFDPWSLKLTKTASSGSTATPLSDAIFRITYYDYVPTQNNNVDQKDGQNIPIKTELQQSKTKAKRIWYIKTSKDDESGEYTAWLDDDHLVKEGTYKTKDPLYYDENKQPIIPMGLITVEEVKAPVGFKVKDWTWYIGVTHTQIENVKTENEPIKLGISEDSDNGYIGVKKKNEAGNRVAGAKYGLYQTKNDANHNVNKVAELTTTLRSNVTGRTDGDIFLASGVPYQATVGKTYYVRETEVPPPTGDIIYLLDDHTYSVTVTEANATIESAVMVDSTDFTTDTPKGSLKVKKTSDDNNVEDIYFALVDNRGHEYEAKKVDADGYAQWDNLQIYERGDSGTKIKYTVKELGYGVTFQRGKTTYTNTQGEYEWTINKADCIEYPTGSKQYYEGVANPIYMTTWNEKHNNEKLYPKWYYRNPEEAKANQNGKQTTLNDNQDETVTMLEFHNSIPRIKIKIHKTGAMGRNNNCLFRVTDSKGTVYSQTGGISGIGDVLQPEVEYSQVQNEPGFLLSCQEYPNSAVPIPMTYSVEEVGWYIWSHTASSTLEEFGDAWAVPIISPAQTADVEKDDELLEFNCINTLSTYNFDITKSSEDGVVKDIWFEITGVITDEAVDTDPSSDDIITNETFAEHPEMWQDIIDQYGDGKCDNETIELYVERENGEKWPLIAYGKDANGDLKEVYRILLKTNENGYTSTNAADRVLYTMEWDEDNNKWVSEILPDNKLYTEEGEELEGIPNVCMDWSAASRSLSYLMFTRVRELGEMQPDGSFKLPDRYIPTGDQYASGFIGNDLHYSFENHVIRGSAKLHKTNDNGEDVPNSIWTLSQKVGIDEKTKEPIYKLVELTKTVDPETQKVTTYSYVNIADTDDVKTMIGDNELYIDSRILVTNDAGDINIDNLPPGEYKLVEIEPPEGYMPLGKELKFAVTPQNYTQTNVVEYDVTDAMSFLPNTGEHGPIIPITVATATAIPAIIISVLYFKKRKNRKLR